MRASRLGTLRATRRREHSARHGAGERCRRSAAGARMITSGPLSAEAKGVFVIAATPFDEAGALDLESADRMTDFYLGAGADGLTVLGMMGEAGKLSARESETFLARVLARVSGRVP